MKQTTNEGSQDLPFFVQQTILKKTFLLYPKRGGRFSLEIKLLNIQGKQ